MGRFIAFLYGLAAYVIFFFTFLYAIGFVTGLVVPKTIDSGTVVPLVEALIVNILLMSVFAVQHSVMARRWFKEWWTQIVPWTIERSTYVLFASLALILLFSQWRPLGGTMWSVQNAAGRAVLWTLFASGWALVLVVTFLINHFDLFGLRPEGRAQRLQPQRPCARAVEVEIDGPVGMTPKLGGLHGFLRSVRSFGARLQDARPGPARLCPHLDLSLRDA